jgi:hypothetical protein
MFGTWIFSGAWGLEFGASPFNLAAQWAQQIRLSWARAKNKTPVQEVK